MADARDVDVSILREVDALTPGSSPLAPPIPPPAWKELGGRLDETTRTIHVPGFLPCDLAAFRLRGIEALEREENDREAPRG